MVSHKLLRGIVSHCMVGLGGVRLDERERRLLTDTPPAGVVLFARNVASIEQLRELTSEITSITAGSSGFHPIIAADHEGGRISVLARAIGVPPTQLAVARARDAQLCGRVCRETARLMRLCGLNMVFAPVADVNSEYLNPVIGSRAFGEDGREVAALVAESVKAYGNGGLLTCIKHFPGHGSTVQDSHVTLPILELTVSQMGQGMLLPFASGIGAGADAVMVGHIAARDRCVPSSLDRTIVDDVLRRGLGFDRVVVTDALEMGGVSVIGPAGNSSVNGSGAAGGAGGSGLMNGSGGTGEAGAGGAAVTGGAGEAGEGGTAHRRGLEEILRLALQAGCDLLLFSRSIGEVLTDLEGMQKEIEANANFWKDYFPVLSEDSQRRVTVMRERCARAAREGAGTEPDAAAHREMLRGSALAYRSVAERSMEVVHDAASILPIRKRGVRFLSFCGEVPDFENDVVRSAIGSVYDSVSKSPQDPPRGEDRHGGEGLSPVGIPSRHEFQPDRLHPLLRCRMQGTDYVVDLHEYDIHGCAAEGARIRVLVNRRPVPREAISHICNGYDVVVVAGWPYAVHFMPDDRAVIVTYGVYDAAFDLIWEVS